jgi:GNAT superfamily N-acetyltransferase
MPSFSTKLAGIGDIPAIIEIQQQTWEPTYREILSPEQIEYMFNKIYSPEALQDAIWNGKQQFLLLMAGEVSTGFASVAEEEPGCFKLHKIYVLPAYQGTGAGRFLLNEVENYVRSVGGEKIRLNVNRFNKAKSFYEKMNFKVVHEEDIPIGPYWMNDYVLEKLLL